MTPKFKEQVVSQKSPTNGVRGPILGQKLSRIHAREAKNPQNCRNCRNLHMILRERASRRGPPRGKLRETPPQRETRSGEPAKPTSHHPVIILLIDN